MQPAQQTNNLHDDPHSEQYKEIIQNSGYLVGMIAEQEANGTPSDIWKRIVEMATDGKHFETVNEIYQAIYYQALAVYLSNFIVKNMLGPIIENKLHNVVDHISKNKITNIPSAPNEILQLYPLKDVTRAVICRMMCIIKIMMDDVSCREERSKSAVNPKGLLIDGLLTHFCNNVHHKYIGDTIMDVYQTCPNEARNAIYFYLDHVRKLIKYELDNPADFAFPNVGYVEFMNRRQYLMKIVDLIESKKIITDVMKYLNDFHGSIFQFVSV